MQVWRSWLAVNGGRVTSKFSTEYLLRDFVPVTNSLSFPVFVICGEIEPLQVSNCSLHQAGFGQSGTEILYSRYWEPPSPMAVTVHIWSLDRYRIREHPLSVLYRMGQMALVEQRQHHL